MRCRAPQGPIRRAHCGSPSPRKPHDVGGTRRGGSPNGSLISSVYWGVFSPFRAIRRELSFLQTAYRTLASSRRNAPIVARPTIRPKCSWFMRRCLLSTGAARADSRWRGKRSISPRHTCVTGVSHGRDFRHGAASWPLLMCLLCRKLLGCIYNRRSGYCISTATGRPGEPFLESPAHERETDGRFSLRHCPRRGGCGGGGVFATACAHG